MYHETMHSVRKNPRSLKPKGMSGDRGLEWSAGPAVFEAEIERQPENIKEKPEGTRMILTAPTTPANGSRSSFCPFLKSVPFLVSALLLSWFWFVQVSVSLYYCNHGVCKNLCWVSRARLCRFFSFRVASSRFFMNGGSTAADSDFCILC
jgi:hypothetical protein